MPTAHRALAIVTLIIAIGCPSRRPGQTAPIIPAPATALSKADALAHPEGYALRLDDHGNLTIESRTEAGRFYAQQTLAQLDRQTPVELYDAPRFRWRGLHFDVARHFFPEADLERLLDLMARYKLNVFHLHLSDDQGFRLPVAKHPELTALGPAYTKQELQRLVQYASERFISIVPEIDLPGHTRALLASHPELSCRGQPLPLPTAPGVYEDVLCAGNPATYALVDDVLREVAAIFPGPYVHLGGDEVPTTRWDDCPKCRALGIHPQTYFLAQATATLRALGKTPVGWDEVLEHQPPSDLVVMAWRREAKLGNGHPTVLAPYDVTYFDRPQNPYDSDAVRLDTVAGFEPPSDALGVEACLWTEHVPDLHRAEVQLFPRLLALADLAWSTSAVRKQTPLARRLPAALTQLDALGVDYFVEPPLGLTPRRAFLDAGTLELHGDGQIEYALDASTTFQPYTQPITVTATTTVSARARRGQHVSPTVSGTIVVAPPLPALAARPEAHYRYFEGRFDRLPDFDALEPSREGAAKGLVPDPVAERDWAAITEQPFEAPSDRVYRFTLTCDDGCRLDVDGTRVIDNDGLHGPRKREGEIALATGPHRLTVQMFQRRGSYRFELEHD